MHLKRPGPHHPDRDCIEPADEEYYSRKIKRSRYIDDDAEEASGDEVEACRALRPRGVDRRQSDARSDA